MLGPFHYAFVQRGALEIMLLSVAAGLLGSWIVLRGLAFYSHAVAGAVLGRRWVAVGFDAAAARAFGARSAVPDAVLLALIALGVVSSLAAIGALLATALFVVPAATVRLLVRRLPAWQLGSVVLAATEGIAGLWLSVEVNVPPGAAVAVLAGGVFALVAAARALRSWRPVALVAACVLLALLVAACGSGGGKAGSVTVVATTTQIGEWTRTIGGGAVTVHQILQPNTDPHEYEPRPADVEATAGATLVLESGVSLDHWMGKVV